MSVHLSDDELEKFYDNGYTNETIQNTVDKYRNDGLSDEQIRAKIDTKLNEFDGFTGNGSEEQPFQIGVNKNIDLRPSALGDNIAKHIVALPIAGYNAIKNKSFKGAYSSALADLDKAKQKMYELDPTQKKIDDFADATIDIGSTFLLPEAKVMKGAGFLPKLVNSVATNTYQGGLVGGIEGLRQGNGLGGATAGSVIGGTIGLVSPLGGAAISKLLPRAGASIAGVTTDTLRQAVKPNSKALDLNKDQAQSLLLDTTQNIRNAYNNLLNKKGEVVQNEVKKLRGSEFRVPIEDLQKDITSTFDNYGGELINPARNMTGKLERNLNELLQGGTSDPRPALGLDKEITTNFIDNPYFSKEKQNEAYDIIGRALGKDKNWVKSKLNDPQYKGVKTQSEKLDMLLNEAENLAEKEATTGDLGSQIYNHYHYNGDSASPEAAEELINNAYNDIVNNNFITNNIDPLTRNINEAELSYRQLLNNVVNNANDQNIYAKAGDDLYNIVKNLPEDVQGSFYERLGNDLDTIYNKTQTISPIDLQKAKQQIGHMVNWSDETARNYQNPILEQIYGKFNNRLSELSPSLAKANEEYANLRNFKKNEGLNRILRAGDNIDSASSALKNYNSTVTKGNTGRNIKDLENILVANGARPFLDTVDDINAAMDLNKSITTGRNFGGVTDIAKAFLVEPALKGIRGLNKIRLLQKSNALQEGVNPNIIKLLYGATRPFND